MLTVDIWPAGAPERLLAAARGIIDDARNEGILLLTADPILAQYPGPVHRV